MTHPSKPPCFYPMRASSLYHMLNMTSTGLTYNPNETLNLNLNLNMNLNLNLNLNLTSNATELCPKQQTQYDKSTAMTFYCYATPILIVMGMLGNALSLKIFLSRAMRRLEASVYLSALSISDLAALLCYVLVDWLRRGVPHLGFYWSTTVSIFEIEGLCQAQMYLSYVTRFLSAWIIVTFTVERYIAVCHPLRRRGFIFGSRSSHKMLLILLVMSCVLMIYKPVLTGRYEYRVRDRIIGKCSRNPSYPILSFILDSIFAMSITLIPFLIITLLNILIIIRLYYRHRRIRIHIVTEESVVRMEFTIIFLVISFVFIAFNLPYFCFWCNRFLKSFYNTQVSTVKWSVESDTVYLMTKICFYLNYSVNFLLYSVGGACFRKELRMMCLFKQRDEYNNYCSRLSNRSNMYGNSINTSSWV